MPKCKTQKQGHSELNRSKNFEFIQKTKPKGLITPDHTVQYVCRYEPVQQCIYGEKNY